MLNSIQGFIKSSIKAKKECNVGVFSQVWDIIRLRRFKVGISDYYMYKLFNPNILESFEMKTTYRGWRFKNELLRLSHNQIQGIAFHKHILYIILSNFGFPIPKIFSLYCPTANGFGRHQAMSSKTDLKKFLKYTNQLPIFGKPSNASHGFGAIGINSRNEEDKFQLADGTTISLDNLVEYIDEIALEVGTYLLCEYLQPSDYFKSVCGSTLPSNRIVVLIRNGIPELFKSTLLLPQNNRHVSNFQGGRNQSLSAGIDIETGALYKVMDSNFNYVQNHPISGKKLEGMRIPDWDSAKKMILKAALSLSPFRMQHWDISYTNKGPVILEMNFIGDLEPMQLHGPPGIFTEQFKSFFESQKF